MRGLRLLSTCVLVVGTAISAEEKYEKSAADTTRNLSEAIDIQNSVWADWINGMIVSPMFVKGSKIKIEVPDTGELLKDKYDSVGIDGAHGFEKRSLDQTKRSCEFTLVEATSLIIGAYAVRPIDATGRPKTILNDVERKKQFDGTSYRIVWPGVHSSIVITVEEPNGSIHTPKTLPRGPNIQPQSQKWFDDGVYDSLPPHLEWGFGPNWSLHVSMEQLWIVQGWSRFGPLDDSEIFQCWYACEKFEEWLAIAKKDKGSQPPSFSKEILLDVVFPSRGLTGAPTLSAIFTWDGPNNVREWGDAQLTVSFKTSPENKIALRNASMAKDFKSLLGLVPYMRTSFAEKKMEKQKELEKINGKFK